MKGIFIAQNPCLTWFLRYMCINNIVVKKTNFVAHFQKLKRIFVLIILTPMLL